MDASRVGHLSAIHAREKIMEAITTAQDVAAIWFIVFFGACLLVPLFNREK